MTFAPKRLAGLQAREEARFVREHPRSRELAHKAREHLLAGVPMHWMAKWPGGFPLVVARSSVVDLHGVVPEEMASCGRTTFARLFAWAERLAAQWSPDEDVWVYFNNDPRGCAPRDAARFARLVERAGLQPSRVPSVRRTPAG